MPAMAVFIYDWLIFCMFNYMYDYSRFSAVKLRGNFRHRDLRIEENWMSQLRISQNECQAGGLNRVCGADEIWAPYPFLGWCDADVFLRAPRRLDGRKRSRLAAG